MRSALICVFIALLVQTEGNSELEDDFRPTPIPLDQWPGDKHGAGTLHEIINTDIPPTVAAVPAHYWEDALRHSVYLTLVRDKIDQLIAKGTVISPDSKPDNNLSSEVDDHDLWEKIKSAQFDRIKEEPIPPNDVTIVAKGRLLEEKKGFRFAEDEVSQDKCNDEKCKKNVKAYWSVKRVRQGETGGKYHYELTFSVTSQAAKKIKKPFENPIRTFTIKETPAEQPVVPRAKKIHFHNTPPKPQRDVWFHKNIVPTHAYPKRSSTQSGLERIFSSLFSDEYDSYEERPPRYKQQNSHPSHPHPQPHPQQHPQPYPQHTRVGYAGEPPHHQKKIVPYPIRHQPVRHSRPPLQAPPISYVPPQSYVDVDPLGYNPNLPAYPDNKYVPSNTVKTTRPAVLPTPITNHPLLKESTIDAPVKSKLNGTDSTTTESIVTTHKIYNTKPTPMKVSYMSDHVRPPVYNAPPGVFVTMDKKPFKPLPPFKYAHSGKPVKHIPYDFRPSPQIHDAQNSNTDVTSDFRPINISYSDIFGSNEESVNMGNKHNRKPAAKKPLKKHGNIKSQHSSTATPEIITVENDYKDDTMEWANLLGALAKTTPMATHTDRTTTENSEIITTTTLATSTEINDALTQNTSDSNEESSEVEKSTSTSTTSTTTVPPTIYKTKKRTRPPPSFKKLDKIKKHKRITTTTTSTTSTTSTTTSKPTRIYPEKKKPSIDLTPQASSAATSGANSLWEINPTKPWTPTEIPVSSPATILTTSPTTTTTTTLTPTAKTTVTTTTTSTTTTPSTTVYTRPAFVIAPKSKNRFRQSTLMYKGTSVKHDKWSGLTTTVTTPKNRSQVVAPGNVYLRRKVSKFHGYIPSTTPRQRDTEKSKEDHEDHPLAFYNEETESTTQQYNENISVKHIEPTKEVQESSDSFITSTVATSQITNNADTDKVTNFEETTVTDQINADAKNKTKCKKKKLDNLTVTEGAITSNTETTTQTVSTTKGSTTPDFLESLFGGFTMDDMTESSDSANSTAIPVGSESGKHEQYLQFEEDIDKFLESINDDDKTNESEKTDQVEYEDESEEESPFANDDENDDFVSQQFDSDYSNEKESRSKPYSFLELMTMG